MKTDKKADREFNTVEFMQQVREELTKQFSQDKQKYLDYLKKSMKDFKLKQQETYCK